MVREVAYDDVHDAQRHFRALLDVMARPGKIVDFPAVTVNPPAGLDTGSAFVALALTDSNASFHLKDRSDAAADYLRMNAGSAEAALSEADFVFAPADSGPEVWSKAKKGSLPYPETGATIVLRCPRLDSLPFDGGLTLELEGPGVDGKKQITIGGLTRQALDAWQEANSEFPLGVDVVIVAPGGEPGQAICAAIPRSTRLSLLS